MRALIFKLTVLAIACFLLLTLFFDQRLQQQTEALLARSTLEDGARMLAEMRTVYRERIAAAHLPLTAAVTQLCPGGVIGEMSRRFAGHGQHALWFGNVASKPRNPANQADAEALAAIRYFEENRSAEQHFSAIRLSDGRSGYQMALPLWVEKSCLTCHGERAQTPALIQSAYQEGFGYREGDLRGVLFARMAAEQPGLADLWRNRVSAAAVTALVLFVVLWLAARRFFLIRLQQLATALKGAVDGRFARIALGARKDELDDVLYRYNAMVDALQAREQTLAEQAEQIIEQRAFLHSVIDSLHDPVMVIGADYRIEAANQTARQMFGPRFMGEGETLCHKALHNIDVPCHEADRRCPLREVMASGEVCRVTHTGLNEDGNAVLYDICASPLRDAHGQVRRIVESFHDVTVLVQNQAELRFSREQLDQQAHSDPLTGLPNRRRFEESLPAALAEAAAHGHTVGLAFIDLDGFKDVNDNLGHPVGDELLQIVAKRLQHCVRSTDFVGRLAGDEFVIVVRDLECREVLQRIAEEVLTVRRQPVNLAGNSVHVTSSIGIAYYPGDASSPEDLVRAADIAMYSAKAAGRNCVRYFSKDLDEAVRYRFEMMRDLKQALAGGEFFLVFQPQFDLEQRSLRGVEALMRWQSPTRGLVSPDAFIPILEESGLILETGEWLLDQTLGQLRRWLDEGMPEIVMSVNVSALEFESPGFVDRVLVQLERHRIAPHLLELEVTERMALSNPEAMIERLAKLREYGIRTAMDDFGTGYSSLSYLTRLPIDTLKIDRSFVRTLPESEKSRGVVRLIAGFGQLMNMEIVAEGVEHPHELDGVSEAGCRFVQGYLFSRPVSAAEIPALGSAPPAP